jgi:hypothetical protein
VEIVRKQRHLKNICGHLRNLREIKRLQSNHVIFLNTEKTEGTELEAEQIEMIFPATNRLLRNQKSIKIISRRFRGFPQSQNGY